ncbi:hypothetical protein Z043_119885, partial [Scleropages formosus]
MLSDHWPGVLEADIQRITKTKTNPWRLNCIQCRQYKEQPAISAATAWGTTECTVWTLFISEASCQKEELQEQECLYYPQRQGSTDEMQSYLESLSLPRISHKNCSFLNSPFSKEEVWDSIRSMPS